MITLSRLGIELDLTRPLYPTTIVLVDGVESLQSRSAWQRAAVEHLVLSGALVPQEPPRWVALYGCGCGDFGCRNTIVRISEADGVVTWDRFGSLNGAPEGMLAKSPEENGFWHPSGSPPIRFDADQYRAELDRAEGDRSWQTRAHVVAEMVERLTGDDVHTDVAGGDAVRLLWSADSTWPEVTLRLPADDPVASGHRLVELLRDHDPDEIADSGWWR